MPARYRYVLDGTVAEEVLTAPARQREQFIKVFRHLADDPFQRGESFFRDSSGREIQKKLFGQWLISFWPDHAVQEMRVVGIQRATR
jgi:hypothetical protein